MLGCARRRHSLPRSRRSAASMQRQPRIILTHSAHSKIRLRSSTRNTATRVWRCCLVTVQPRSTVSTPLTACHVCRLIVPFRLGATVAFSLYDVDSSGMIDRTEFAALVRNMLMGQANTVRACRRLSCRAKPGLMAMTVLVLQEVSLMAAITDEFEQADTDSDGMISVEEWRVAAQQQPRIAKCACQRPWHCRQIMRRTTHDPSLQRPCRYLASIDALHRGHGS